MFAQIGRELRYSARNELALVRIFQPPGDYPVAAFEDLTLQLCYSDGLSGRVDHGTVFEINNSPGDFALSPAGTALRYTVEGPAEFLGAVLPRRALLLATEDIAPGWNGDCGALHAGTWQDATQAALLERMWDEADAGSPNGRIVIDSLWLAMASLLARRAGVVRRAVDAPRCDARVRRATTLMRDRLDTDLGLDDIAGEVGLTGRQLSTLFQRHLGSSPGRWLIHVRVDRAKELLSNTNRSITEIALDCGFSSSQHFATVFKRITAVTPGEYRRRRRA